MNDAIIEDLDPIHEIIEVRINVKHDDRASLIAFHRNNTETRIDGYMPYAGVFGGDYTKLTIDNLTGTIIGWKPIKASDLKDENDDSA